MGTGSCSSSNCHGASSPRNSSNVLQNEYTTWQKHDRHAKAWLVLKESAAQRIGQHLGIAAVEKEPWCLSCHATYSANKTIFKPGFNIEDGVTCETCHGAAENYLPLHTERGASHNKNIASGMRELVPLQERAHFCLTCHYGSDAASVTHRLIGAGHPRLSFELDTYSMLQPYHWKVDEDYVQRKHAYSNVNAWLVGQIALARSTLSAVSSPKRSKFGAFPELSLLECYSCHHSLRGEQWKSRTYEGHPGELRLNVAPFFMLQHALSAMQHPSAGSIERLTAALEEAYRKQSLDNVVSDFQAALAGLGTDLSARTFSAEELRRIIVALARVGAALPHLQYESAEQIAMGISATAASLGPDAAPFKVGIELIYSALKDVHEFKSEDFSKACQSLGNK
ncbi:MAG: cytochrome c family protein [Oligoflexia bacterium]|nr:cytochrome c family protein [Oligoflexia bacterium]